MAQRSGFFNALNVNGVYDRKYNANDYCDNLAVIISNGVLRSADDDLKVTASGMTLTVGVGRAWINGHYYYNDSPVSFAIASAPIGGARYDRIVLRFNKALSARDISLVYVQGAESNNPVKPSPIREGDIYDLVLADIYVGTNANNVTVTDTRADTSVCGWVFSTKGDESFYQSLDNSFMEWFEEKKDVLSSVTLFKRYNWRTVLETAAQSVAFNIPQYRADTSFIEVFVNGLVKTDVVDYTLSGTILTFKAPLIAGTEIEVKCYKSIDGTGIESVAGEITALQNQVAALQSDTAMNYICNGVNDNIGISDMAQAFLDGTGVFANSDADAQLTIKVCGKFGASSAYSGAGTTVSPSVWFALGKTSASAKKVVVDFANCEKVSLSLVAYTTNTIFGGHDCHIRNANVLAHDASGASVLFFGGIGDVSAHNCRLTANVKGFAVVSYAGTFRDCTTLMMAGGNAISFYGTNGQNAILIDGGSHRAYAGTSSNISAVVYSGSADTSAIVMVSGAKFPALAVSGYTQRNAISFDAGYLSGTGNITTLPISIGTAAKSTLTGTIPLNKE